MKIPATLDQIGAVALIVNHHPVQHACKKGGYGLLSHTYHANGSFYHCLGCPAKWSRRVMDGLGAAGRTARFFVDVEPRPEAPMRLVWVTEGKRRFTTLTSDPTLGVPYSEER